jgi:hypothetical protein
MSASGAKRTVADLSKSASADIVPKVENPTTLKSREVVGLLAAASLYNATTEVRYLFWMKR